MRKNLIDAIAFQTGRVLRKTVLVFAGVVGITGICWDPQPVEAATTQDYRVTEVVLTEQKLRRTQSGYTGVYTLTEWDGDCDLMQMCPVCEVYERRNHVFGLSKGDYFEEPWDWAEDGMTGDVYKVLVDPNGELTILGYVGYVPFDESSED